MEKMMVPLMETVIDPEGFTATTIDGQLRSDLIAVMAKKATGYRLWKEKPEGKFDSAERTAMTAEAAEMLSRDRSGRWEFYAVQIFDRKRLLFSAGRWGTEMMLFHVAEERTKALTEKIMEYDGVEKVKVYPMPKETMERWARRVV